MGESIPLERQVILAPGGYFGATVATGQRVRIVDLEGQQVSDFMSFAREDPREQLSMYSSRAVNSNWRLTAPHQLYSNLVRPMWQIEVDTVGENYCGGGYCNARMNALRYGAPDAPNCETNLEKALAPYGLNRWSFGPDTCFNIFMTYAYEMNGVLEIREPKSGAGDEIILRALMPQIVAISNCPQVRNPVNAGRLKPLRVEILN
ncbi:MAG: urea carboxylase [Pseudomonadota bacterium]|jgi:uncharacterized protein YcgI (DUF1989 family)|nr:urea carboxylase-associated family protein [Rubrivivax sp.]NLZ40383.1 urea carboxylase-associated family protein [Comamonadaceae bacterium]